VTLKVKFKDFEIITRSRSVAVAVSSRSELERLSMALLQNVPLPDRCASWKSRYPRCSATPGRTATRPGRSKEARHDHHFKGKQHAAISERKRDKTCPALPSGLRVTVANLIRQPRNGPDMEYMQSQND
jgi:hypothetical protein